MFRRRGNDLANQVRLIIASSKAYYNPSILSSLYQDAAGTTPVTADDDPVGLMLDLHESDGRGVVNLLTFTEQFDNAAWGKSRTTTTANSVIAPDGTLTADTLVETTDTNVHYVASPTTALLAATQYEFSVYVKKGTVDSFQLTGDSASFSSTYYSNFDLNLGVLGTYAGAGNTPTITDVGGGWYRCTSTFTTSATPTGVLPVVVAFNNNDSSATRLPNYTGSTGSNIYIWGAQLELGSTATTYQPNTATVGGPGNHASQSTADSRPVYDIDGNGNAFINHDAIDDQLVTVFPDLGTDATVAYSTSSGTTILTGQTISGSYNLPTDDWYGLIVMDRALSSAETSQVTRFLNQLAGV